MKNTTLISFILFCLLSCKQNQKKNIAFSLEYVKNGNELILIFENSTPQNIVFPVPNTLEFGDENYKSFSTQGGKEGSFPITTYAIIKPDQSSKFFQKKLDSIRDNDFFKRGMPDVIKEIKQGDGNSVFFLKSKAKIKIKYNLVIKSMMVIFKKSYSSKFKQNYYPYDKVLKGNYPEGEYLRRFSKLNFGKAKFVAQPLIEDSLILKISEKDLTN